MSYDQTTNTVLELLSSLRPDVDFRTSQDFVAEGLLDSFDIVSLVSALDERLSINIDGRQIVPENFTNVHSIARLVDRTLADQKGPA